MPQVLSMGLVFVMPQVLSMGLVFVMPQVLMLFTGMLCLW